MSILFAAIFVVHGLDRSAAQAAQAGSADLRITSAIFGTGAGSADVTPMVVHLTKPGVEEFYAAPYWLEVDPVVGQNKTLVVFYEYRGKPLVLTTTEPGAVSHAILLEHAGMETPREAQKSDTGKGPAILSAYYGRGKTYVPAAARVRELMQSSADPFVVDDVVMEMRPTASANVLVMAYAYQGRRYSLVAWQWEQVGVDRLVAQAARPVSSRAAIAPAWVKDARPDPPREPGSPGPGVGRSPRREVAISELIKALAELQAIAAGERRDAVTQAIPLTQSALVNAQRNIGYVFPLPTTSGFEPRRASAAEHVTNATLSLRRALDQLGAAGPGRGSAFLARSLSEIKAALTALATFAP